MQISPSMNLGTLSSPSEGPSCPFAAKPTCCKPPLLCSLHSGFSRNFTQVDSDNKQCFAFSSFPSECFEAHPPFSMFGPFQCWRVFHSVLLPIVAQEVKTWLNFRSQLRDSWRVFVCKTLMGTYLFTSPGVELMGQRVLLCLIFF